MKCFKNRLFSVIKNTILEGNVTKSKIKIYPLFKTAFMKEENTDCNKKIIIYWHKSIFFYFLIYQIGVSSSRILHFERKEKQFQIFSSYINKSHKLRLYLPIRK